MAVDIKIDILGSSLRRGFVTGQYDRAIRMARVSGLGVSNQKHQEAVDEVVALFAAHQSQIADELPLAAVQTQQLGPDRLYVRCEYFRPPAFFSFNDPRFETLARYRTATRHVRWYQQAIDDDGNPAFSSAGYPNGFIAFHAGEQALDDQGDPLPNIKNPLAQPVAWRWLQPLAEIVIPAETAENPMPVVGQFIGRVNQNAVTLDGFIYPPNTLRFNGVDVGHFINSFQQVVFRVQYQFTFAYGGHANQAVEFDVGAEQWTPKFIIEHEVANFDPNQFPVA